MSMCSRAHKCEETGTFFRKSSGLTLLEVLITLSILAIISVFAFPSMSELLRDKRASSQVKKVVASIEYARSESVSRNIPVSICSSSNLSSCKVSDITSWEDGWIAFTDRDGSGAINDSDMVLRAFSSESATSSLTLTVGAFTLSPSGFLGESSAVAMVYQPNNCTGNNRFTVTIQLTGRHRVTRGSCS
jgi:type IV fimbrial biogenesis protein FimT